MLGLPQAVGDRAAGKAKLAHVEIERPLQEDQRDEDGGGRNGGGGRLGAPGYCRRRRDERDEQRERERVMAGGEHKHHRGEQIGGKRAG